MSKGNLENVFTRVITMRPEKDRTLYASKKIKQVNVTVPTLFKSPPSPSPGLSSSA
jgi:hypothetical protein